MSKKILSTFRRYIFAIMEEKAMKNTMMEKKNTVWKKALVLSSAMLMGISLMACGGKGVSEGRRKGG